MIPNAHRCLVSGLVKSITYRPTTELPRGRPSSTNFFRIAASVSSSEGDSASAAAPTSRVHRPAFASLSSLRSFSSSSARSRPRSFARSRFASSSSSFVPSRARLFRRPLGPSGHGMDDSGRGPFRFPDEPTRVRIDGCGEVRMAQRLPGRYPLSRVEGHEAPEQVGGERPDGTVREHVEKRPGHPAWVRVPAPTLQVIHVVPGGGARGTKQFEYGQQLVQRPRALSVRELVEEGVSQAKLREDAPGAPHVNLRSVRLSVAVPVVQGRTLVLARVVVLDRLVVQKSLGRHVVRHRARPKWRHRSGRRLEPAARRPARDGDPAASAVRRGIQQQVAGVEVAVAYAARVRVLEGAQNLSHHRPRPLPGERRRVRIGPRPWGPARRRVSVIAGIPAHPRPLRPHLTRKVVVHQEQLRLPRPERVNVGQGERGGRRQRHLGRRDSRRVPQRTQVGHLPQLPAG
mmetsp:Transcript_9301/g.40846  ORF Transcript_9301/g.40846 Transcript_9301/m.40846 type:complete len:459 (+) Transcript_9301:65-1441(+)